MHNPEHRLGVPYANRQVAGRFAANGGFGLVAWPAEYGATGIHTFIVNQNGTVYQKDLALVPGKPLLPITRFDPDHSWEPVD
jgi:hypothetical protein